MQVGQVSSGFEFAGFGSSVPACVLQTYVASDQFLAYANVGGRHYMVPSAGYNAIMIYSFSITGTADGGATYTLSGQKLEVKCLGGIGYTGIGTYDTEVKYLKIVEDEGATSIYVFPTTLLGNLESFCPIISYLVTGLISNEVSQQGCTSPANSLACRSVIINT